MIDDRLLEVSSYGGEGYRPLVTFGEWRVAVLRYIDELEPKRIKKFQRHEKTDEIFVLLSGEFMLLLGDGGDGDAGSIYAQKLELHKVYNVKRGVWHSHTLKPDTEVLIVENDDTGDDNSPSVELKPDQIRKLLELAADFSSKQ